MDTDLTQSAPKYTGWYNGDQRPARPGVYQRLLPQGGMAFSYYGDGIWHGGRLTPQLASGARKPSTWQSQVWRGLDREVKL